MKMKFVYLSAAVLALGSCSNEVLEDGFADKSNAIVFNSYTPKTRVMGEDVTTENMKNDHFGVAGYTTSDNKIYLYKGTNSGVEQEWAAGTSTWEYANMEDLKFWPAGNMDFYAYFPFSDNATFAATNVSGNVMTITGTTCNHDVLFAYHNSGKISRVPLAFHHAFSKVKGVQIEMPAEGTLYKSKCQVQVQKVEFINTATSGDILVDNTGVATYSGATTPLTQSTTVVDINRDNATTATPYALIDNGESAKGYLFATNGTEQNKVIGTNKTLWNGVNLVSGTLSGSNLVCLKLTCKVWNGTDTKKYYYVGDDANYGDVYIPLTGSNVTDPNPDVVSATAFIAGKRYTYKIVMKDNVGFDDNGDPILTPILFNVNSVDAWEDVTVTITL